MLAGCAVLSSRAIGGGGILRNKKSAHRAWLPGLTVLCLLAGAAAPAWGQDPSAQAAQEAERRLREQEQRRQEQLERDRASPRPPARLDVAPPELAPRPGDVCRDVATIELDGAGRLSRRERDRIVSTYRGRCLTVGDLERLLGDVTKAYIDRGYAAARAYLPEQDLADGSLEVLVLEGEIARIELAPGSSGVWIAGAFPGASGRPLNLRDLEQGLDQLNRLSSNDARLSLRPGERPGESVVVIENTPGRRVHGSLTADNLGAEATGRTQYGATVSFESLLGLNELISVTQRESEPFRSRSSVQSGSTSVFASLPFGRALFSGGWSKSDYGSLLQTPGGQRLQLEGNGEAVFVGVTVAALRTRLDRASVSAVTTVKDSESFVAGQRLDVSSRRLAVTELDINLDTTRAGAFFNAGVGVSIGLNAFDALNDAKNLPDDAPRAQFTKYRLTAGVFDSFRAGPLARWEVSSQLSAQYAQDVLYGSEQFFIGGYYSVRGFHDVSLANDHGLLLRNEIAWSRPTGPLFGVEGVIRPYFALDVGRVWGRADGTPEGTLAGAAAGARLNLGKTSLDFFAARAIDAPDTLKDEGLMLFARFSARL